MSEGTYADEVLNRELSEDELQWDENQVAALYGEVNRLHSKLDARTKALERIYDDMDGSLTADDMQRVAEEALSDE